MIELFWDRARVTDLELIARSGGGGGGPAAHLLMIEPEPGLQWTNELIKKTTLNNSIPLQQRVVYAKCL